MEKCGEVWGNADKLRTVLFLIYEYLVTNKLRTGLFLIYKLLQSLIRHSNTDKLRTGLFLVYEYLVTDKLRTGLFLIDEYLVWRSGSKCGEAQGKVGKCDKVG